MTADQRFPELEQFELELQGNNGSWSTFRANEDERAAHVLNDASAIGAMLCGAEVTVVQGDVRTQCRLTPKAWLEKKS